MDIDKLRESLSELVSFSDKLIFEMRDFKSDEYRMGVADGVEMALDMLKSYLEDFPELKDASKENK